MPTVCAAHEPIPYEKWLALTPILRDAFLAKARLLLISVGYGLQMGRYKELAVSLYGDISGVVSVTTFKERLNSLTTAENLSKSCESQLTIGASYGGARGGADTGKNTKTAPTLTTLEETVHRSLPLLHELHDLLQNTNTDTTWADEATRITTLATPPKVYIAVTGNTGTGKSSLINALTDEERILTTNCMRAATAVAIEIAYNADSTVRYRAEIEFVSAAEWERELVALKQALRAEADAVAVGQVASDSEAAVALDKIRAVYPRLRTAGDVLDVEVGELMALPALRGRLGGRVVLEEDDVKLFSKKLRAYIDSRAEGKKKSPGKGEKEADEGGIWPLIRVVRVFLKSAVLATGAVLVDLPGVYDSNAGRTAVSLEYKKRCAAHWVVAPINRAVDDKVAHELLDDSSRMQMHMDNAFNDITFICTTTDDISVAEVEESLRLEESATELSQDQSTRREELQARLAELCMKRDIIRDELETVDDNVEKLEAQLAEAPADLSETSPNKRKHSDITLPGSATPERDAFQTAEAPPASRQTPELSNREQLTARYASAKGKRKDLNAQRKRLRQDVTRTEEELHALNMQDKARKEQAKRQCVEARNAYSKQELKRGFVQVLRETDQELYESPPRPERDYRAAEEQLPVFCVSTRAYQWIQGRMPKESVVEGFTTLEQTEIPQLQRHCISLTERAREAAARRFLVEVNRLLQSLSVWTTPNPLTAELSEEQRRAIEVELTRAGENMKDTWQRLRARFGEKLEEAIEHHIASKASAIIARGQEKFPGAVRRWNTTMRYNTLQAVCRGDGVHRQHNLNQELANLALRRLVAAWRVVFDEKVPQLTLDLQRRLDRTLNRFHAATMASVSDIPASVNQRLGSIKGATADSCAQHLRMAEEGIRNGSKDLHRQFAESIAEKLRGTYRACAEQHGRGTLRRIQRIMSDTARTRSQAVFQHSMRRLVLDLATLQRNSDSQLQSIETTFTGVVRDYHAALVAPQIQQATASQAQIKTAVQTLVEKMETTLQLEAILTPTSSPTVKKEEDVEALDDGH
ncbi:hypothetical protein P168DRAFT_318570 [Aspergillus campestris IBT 28561]|uniref:Uncharacterized protein n=1 Tax=Aspergillus campestris (strain IBT 28561) TaxID=1392248 RepID=A0A2I1D2X4_ASPC2|nr:uncharacterized protein P168DRAFT_318570 [Aspergillus campestris IBT 28561]PKY04225.1 hypothetical protein P168DRAFT_318570 [Aspergillus campestris IBT 28561]